MDGGLEPDILRCWLAGGGEESQALGRVELGDSVHGVPEDWVTGNGSNDVVLI